MRVGKKDLKIVSSCQLVIFRDFYVQFKMVLYFFNFLVFLMGIMLLIYQGKARVSQDIFFTARHCMLPFFPVGPQPSK